MLKSSAVNIDDIYYRLNSDSKTAEVAENPSKYSGNIVIPATAIYNEIEYSVTSIGKYAFYECSDLTSVIIPEGVMTIDNYAFNGCQNLTSITIPNSVTKVGEEVFRYCRGLSSVTIGRGLTTIGKYTFGGCKTITTMWISCSPTSIGKEIFYGCDNIKEIVFDCETIYSYLSGKTSIEKITIKEGVTSIGDNAFKGCSGLNSVTIPESVTSIGNNSFSGCTGLAYVNIPNSVVSIGENAFYQTQWLNFFDDGLIYSNNWLICIKGNLPSENIIIPEGTKGIASGAFGGCIELNSVTIPSSVFYLGDGIFSNCVNLTSVSMPISLVSLPNSTFFGCRSLISFTIPESVMEIGNACFSGCSDLSSIILPEGLSKLGDYAFGGCRGIKSITIPENVTKLGMGVFSGCSACKTIKLPEKLNFIGENCFEGCTNLGPLLVIPDNVSYIGIGAFSGCANLSHVFIGKGIEMILQNAFVGTNLKDLYIYADTAPEVRSSTFNQTSDSEVFLYVPYSSKGQYQRTVNRWDYFFVTPIKEMKTGLKSNDEYWTTFYNGKHEYFADQYTTVYVAELDEANQKLKLKEVEDKIVKKGEGVILKSSIQDIFLYYTSQSANDSFFEQNDLQGIDDEIEVNTLGNNIYSMRDGNEGLGFYKTIDGYLAAHSTYLSNDKNSKTIPIVITNYDGNIDIQELISVILASPSDKDVKSYDLNNDGKVNIADIVILVNILTRQ